MTWLSRIHKITLVLTLFLLTFCFQLGCAAQKSYKAGIEWEQQEEYYKAGQKFLFSLHKKPKNADYRAALKRVAKPAYEQGLLLATTAQNNADFPNALAYYQELKAFTKGLRRHDLLTFQIIDVDAYINDMAVAAAKERYEAGLKAMENARYKLAIEHFQAALSFKANYSDTKKKIAESYYVWAENAFEELQYQTAVERFQLSNQSLANGYKDAPKRASDILFSIGKYYVKRSRCQAGWEELKRAEEIFPTQKIRDEIAKAKECAIRDLVIVQYTDADKDRKTGLKNQNFLVEAISEQASPFAESNLYVNLHTIALRSRLLGLTNHPRLADFDRLLFVEVDQVAVYWGDWKRISRTEAAKMWDRCTEGDDLCQKDVTVEYVESRRSLAVTPKGSMSMMTTSDSEVWSYDIKKALNKEVRYADRFIVDGVAVNIGTQKRLGTVVLSEELYALAQSPKTLSANAVAKEMFQTIATDVAENIVERAGREAETPELTNLAIESSK